MKWGYVEEDWYTEVMAPVVKWLRSFALVARSEYFSQNPKLLESRAVGNRMVWARPRWLIQVSIPVPPLRFQTWVAQDVLIIYIYIFLHCFAVYGIPRTRKRSEINISGQMLAYLACCFANVYHVAWSLVWFISVVFAMFPALFGEVC